MRPRNLVPIALALAVAPAMAHDFWIQPARFAVPVGAALPFDLLVGHGTYRQRWSVDSSRVVRFETIGPGGRSDRRRVLHTTSGDDDGTLALAPAGLHLVVLESSPAISVLPSIRFNDYLKLEGLTPAIVQRERLGKVDTDGREFYSRRAKALVRVGISPDAAADLRLVTRPTGLKLEIVPQKNPYALKPGEPLPVTILYEGRPLAGATVKLNNLDFDAEPIAVLLSDRAGQAVFNVPQRGRWQLNVIWTKPIRNTRADFETIFSSLTLGYDTPRPAA